MNGWMIGNNFAGEMAKVRWRAMAFEHGFSGEREMWETLIGEWSIRALGDLAGVDMRTVQRRFKVCGVKNPRGPGGANHRKPATKQMDKMRKHPDYIDYVQRLEMGR